MKKQKSIPIILGITGHRDLCPDHLPQLRKSLSNILKEYKNKYKNTKIILISALAEGADMLAAEVAKELDITLNVVLPYDEEEYLKSFQSNEAIDQYHKLKKYASDIPLVLHCEESSKKEDCYQKQGEYIADTSNILIALWDGKVIDKKGGTSAIVEYIRYGFKDNHFDHQDGNALFIINTPRQVNPEIESPFTVQYEYLGRMKEEGFADIFKEIDNLNSQINKNIISGDTHKQFFEKKAEENQNKYQLYMKLILVLSWLAIFSLELMHNRHIDSFIIGYGLGILIAFGIFHFLMKKGRIENDFIYSRGFSEALRVQNAWKGAGINESVAQYYLDNHHHKFTWVRVALKNINYLYNEPQAPDLWRKEQTDYFIEKIAEKKKKLHFLELLEHWLYKSGFYILLAMFIYYGLELSHILPHGSLPFSWHLLVLISGTLLMTAAFIGEKYVKVQGYEEDIYNYNILLGIFKDASTWLEKTKDKKEKRKIIYELGIKALDENSRWLVLHESRRIKPSLEG